VATLNAPQLVALEALVILAESQPPTRKRLAAALGTATALAAGIALGEWLARQMRRPPRLTRYGEVKRPKIQRRRRRHAAGTDAPDGTANPVEGRTRLSRSARAKFGRRYGRAPGDQTVDW